MKCKICGGSQTSFFVTVEDYYLTGDVFDLIKCEECGTVQTLIALRDDFFDKYYQTNYYAHQSSQLKPGPREKVHCDLLRIKKGEKISCFSEIRAQLLRKLLLVELPDMDKGTLLDVGSGSGQLLAVAREVGFQCDGVDPSQTARESIMQLGCNAYPDIKFVDRPNEYYDIIVFNQSLEHMTDPYDSLTIAVKLLKKMGKMIISVPNFACNERKIFGKYWRHIDCPRHLFHFSPNSMKVLINRCGLKLIATRYKFFGIPTSTCQMVIKCKGRKVAYADGYIFHRPDSILIDYAKE